MAWHGLASNLFRWLENVWRTDGLIEAIIQQDGSQLSNCIMHMVVSISVCLACRTAGACWSIKRLMPAGVEPSIVGARDTAQQHAHLFGAQLN